MEPQFDIVIPVGPNDAEFFKDKLEYNKKNIIGYRNIYIISKNAEPIEGCIMIDENTFPFNYDDVVRIHRGRKDRAGWYLQQLLKFYAGFVIPGILPRYLVVDADTIFLKPIQFVDEQGIMLFNVGTEYFKPYFNHMYLVHPHLKKRLPYSGICHHMIFDRNYVEILINMVESYHENTYKFWEIFLEKVNTLMVEWGDLIYYNGASEYEMYLNYMIAFYKNSIKIRKLNWSNASEIEPDKDYVSIHYHMRKN